MNEKHIESHFLWVVANLGGKTWKFSSPGHSGVADRVVCLPDGSTWFVELKAPDGRLSPLQIRFAADMKRLNQNYVCIRTLDEADAFTTVSRTRR